MRGIWGFLGLIVALAIVALLVKQQTASVGKSLVQPSSHGKSESVQVQSQQIQQQVRQAVEAAMAPARDTADDQ